MTQSYHDRLFQTYSATHLANLDEDASRKLRWFDRYAGEFYMPVFPEVEPSRVTVLEIGCNRGYLLNVLREAGYTQLVGIDLSPDDIMRAEALVPEAELICGDARELVASRPGEFDVIIIKAVLEHWKKDDVLPFIELMHDALKSGGRLLVDVPNMDWLFATHERFMDFTHEIGFTQQSLRQVLSQVFPEVTARPIDFLEISRRQRLQLRLARRLLGTLLRWAHPEGAVNPFWARSLLGVGVKGPAAE